MSAECRIVEIGRQSNVEAIDPECAANQCRFREIHADRPLCRNHFDERTTILGNGNALTACRGVRCFGYWIFSRSGVRRLASTVFQLLAVSGSWATAVWGSDFASSSVAASDPVNMKSRSNA